MAILSTITDVTVSRGRSNYELLQCFEVFNYCFSFIHGHFLIRKKSKTWRHKEHVCNYVTRKQEQGCAVRLQHDGYDYRPKPQGGWGVEMLQVKCAVATTRFTLTAATYANQYFIAIIILTTFLNVYIFIVQYCILAYLTKINLWDKGLEIIQLIF